MAGDMGGGAPNFMTQDQFNSQLDAWWKKQQPLQQSAAPQTMPTYRPSYGQQPQQSFSPLQGWSPYGAQQQQPMSFFGGYGGGGFQSPFGGYGMGYSMPTPFGGYGMSYGQQTPFSYGQSMGGFGGFMTPFSGYRQPMFGGYSGYGQPAGFNQYMYGG